MDNNDLLIRLRYALDIKNSDMVAIFKLGGIEVSKDEVMLLLTKTPDSEEDAVETENHTPLDNAMFEMFLNGLITFKRGPKPGAEAPELSRERANNLLLKKVKIALQLTTEDIIDIIGLAGVTITKSELGALLRKEGHKNYMECGDKFARNFLKGLAIKYRK
ncbi:MAG TPA: DUF1456 family protein [Planococcus sp. (in: firmicutes)]|nr:DUF1456 family protein [Planococcus sp. (in: firmicutes)]